MICKLYVLIRIKYIGDNWNFKPVQWEYISIYDTSPVVKFSSRWHQPEWVMNCFPYDENKPHHLLNDQRHPDLWFSKKKKQKTYRLPTICLSCHVNVNVCLHYTIID